MGLNIIKNFLFKKMVYNFTKIISSINLKPVELIIKNDERCLCLAPHADDESIGMGGVLSLYPNNFDIVLLTDGRKGINDVSVDEVIKIRENEFKNALNIAGVSNYSFLNIEDKKLLNGFNEFKKLDLIQYDYIFVPNIIDQHPDHKAVSILLSKLIEEKNVKIKPNLKICFYEVWSTLGFVNAFVDISEVIESKKSMINCYKSQTVLKDYEYYSLGLNQYRGMFKDKKYVEAFCIFNLDDFKKITKLY